MRRAQLLCVFALPLVAPSCVDRRGDAGLLDDPGLLTLANCTAEALRDGNVVIEELGVLMTGVGGALPSGFSYNTLTGAFAIDTPEGIRITGMLASPHDLSDGLQVGELADVAFMLSGNGLTGNGVMTFVFRAENEVATSGGFVFDNGECSFEASRIDLVSDPTEQMPEFVGTLDFRIDHRDGDVLEGAMALDGQQVAVSAVFNGSTSIEFTIGLQNYNVTI